MNTYWILIAIGLGLVGIDIVGWLNSYDRTVHEVEFHREIYQLDENGWPQLIKAEPGFFKRYKVTKRAMYE